MNTDIIKCAVPVIFIDRIHRTYRHADAAGGTVIGHIDERHTFGSRGFFIRNVSRYHKVTRLFVRIKCFQQPAELLSEFNRTCQIFFIRPARGNGRGLCGKRMLTDERACSHRNTFALNTALF